MVVDEKGGTAVEFRRNRKRVGFWWRSNLSTNKEEGITTKKTRLSEKDAIVQTLWHSAMVDRSVSLCTLFTAIG